jgi:thioesterase domain-containing protein
VREAVVIAREDVAGEKRLVAYVVGEADAGQLRMHLQQSLPGYMVPAAFVILERLPLTPNGKLDRKALPAPQYGRPELALDAPQNPTELQLILIWEELLGVRPISPTQDFFDLGGHSLLALHLLAEIKRKLNCNLALATLFAGATIRHMANEIIAQQGSPDAMPHPASIIPLQPQGALPPLYCVHPAGRGVYAYVSLARHLGADQPVFGIPDLGDNLGRPLPQIAAEHVAAMRAEQPNGPYYLLGWSFGGKLVYEMAVQLEREKQVVAFVGVLDTVEPGTRGNLDEVEDADLVIAVATDLAEIMRRPFSLTPEDIKSLAYEDQIRCAVDSLRKQKAAPLNYDAEALRESCEAIRARVISQSDYAPDSFSGKVTLFRAMQARSSKDLTKWMQSWGEDERQTLGWCRRAPNRLEVHWVPGTHSTLCSEPHVRVLGQRIRESLCAARQNTEAYR